MSFFFHLLYPAFDRRFRYVEGFACFLQRMPFVSILYYPLFILLIIGYTLFYHILGHFSCASGIAVLVALLVADLEKMVNAMHSEDYKKPASTSENMTSYIPNMKP